jgi:hypothetical protein
LFATHDLHRAYPLEKVRDVSFGEDTAASRTGSRLANLATIRAAIILHLRGLD